MRGAIPPLLNMPLGVVLSYVHFLTFYHPYAFPPSPEHFLCLFKGLYKNIGLFIYLFI
jgi:hypothetical protein